MQYLSSLLVHVRSLQLALLLVMCTGIAYGADSYNPSSQQLTIPTMVIGGTTYLNMVVNIWEYPERPFRRSAQWKRRQLQSAEWPA